MLRNSCAQLLPALALPSSQLQHHRVGQGNLGQQQNHLPSSQDRIQASKKARLMGQQQTSRRPPAQLQRRTAWISWMEPRFPA